MSIEIPLLKLQDAWRVCERHIYHLGHALSAIRTFSPLTAESIDLLTDEQVQDIDQFILRYTKLQDTMGTRLFTSILNYLYEPGLEMHIQRLSWVKNYQKILAIGQVMVAEVTYIH